MTETIIRQSDGKELTLEELESIVKREQIDEDESREVWEEAARQGRDDAAFPEICW